MQLLQDTFIIEQLQVLSEGKDNGKMKIKGVFGRCNEKNNNGRIYPTAVLESQLAKVQPMISERRLCGELDHPQNDTVKLSNASHLITKLDMKGDELIGEAEILNTPAGLTAAALVNGGVKIGISSRGMGTLSEDQNGDKVVNEDFRLVTFDLVADPSTRGAYPGLSESTESQYVRETQSKLTKEGNFVTMLESKMRDAYQPFIEEAKLSKKQKKVMDTDGDDDIDAKDLKTLRSRKDEAMDSIRRDGHWHRIAGMVAEALGHELSEDYGKGYPKMGIKPGTPAAKKEANKRKKKVNESFATAVSDAEKERRERLAVTGHSPRSLTGPGWRDRRNIKKAVRAQGSEDIRQSRLKARAEAGGDVGLRAKLASTAQKMSGGRMGDKTTAMLGGTKSAAYAKETQRIAQKNQAAAQPKSDTSSPTKSKVTPQQKKKNPQLTTKQQQDIARGRQATDAAKRGTEAAQAQAALKQRLKDKQDKKAGTFGAGTRDVPNPSLAGPKKKLPEWTSYSQIGHMLAEMFHLREAEDPHRERLARAGIRTGRRLGHRGAPDPEPKSTRTTRKLKSGEHGRAGRGGGPRITTVPITQKETDDKREHGSIRP